MRKGHGNIRKQRRRRERNYDESLFIEDEVEMIDGNYTHYPYAWCKYHQGWLTKNMAELHGCEKKECPLMMMYEETYVFCPKGKQNIPEISLEKTDLV